MRHRKNKRYLGRDGAHRRALFRNLVSSLIVHERIETTEAKGKEIRAIADQMISLGREGTLAARRAAFSYLQNRKTVSHLFSRMASLWVQPEGSPPTGGYTRLIKTRLRYGDGAPMVIVEFTRRTPSEAQDKKSEDTRKITPPA